MPHNKFFKKYDYDISLDEGVGTYLISWVTGLMVFFVTLALAVNFGLSTVTQHWATGLSGTVTIEIKPPAISPETGEPTSQAKEDFNSTIIEMLSFLKNHPEITEANKLTPEEIKNLITPWIGEDISLDTLPLPALIDVKLKPESDIALLQEDLKQISPSALIDTHSDTLDKIKTLVNTANLFVLLLTSVTILLAVISIGGIVRSKLLIHSNEIKTLHLIGASDEYIARQFRHYTLRNTVRGAAIGLFSTLILLLAISAITHTLNANLFLQMSIMPAEWLILIISPLVAGSMIAHITAQATVLKALSKLP